jgi:serine/threonine-protein kinase
LNFGQVWRYALHSQAQPIRVAGAAATGFPIWSPDGGELVFQRSAPGGLGLYAIKSDGSAAQPTMLLQEDDSIPEDWTADGKLLMIQTTSAPTGTDLFLLERATLARRPWLQTPSNEAEARISPSGRWVAYVSDQTGRAEVWVRAFDGSGAPVRVSADGGHEPRWSAREKTIYFANGTRMMAADISLSPTITASPPRQLFEGGFIPYNSTHRRTFDVTPDDRLLVVQTDAVEPNQPLVVLLNALGRR